MYYILVSLPVPVLFDAVTLGTFTGIIVGWELDITAWLGIIEAPIPYPYLLCETHYEKPISTKYANKVSYYIIRST